MLYKSIVISLIIIAIHVSTMSGMIFGNIASKIDDFLLRHNLWVLSAPLHPCLICMGGLWTLILYPMIFGLQIEMIWVMLIVIGLNSIFSHFIKHLYQ